MCRSTKSSSRSSSRAAAWGWCSRRLQVLAFATLPASMRTEGASLFSLLRNIGAAIGVSVTSSLLAHNSQALHEMIGASVTPFNRALQTIGPVHQWLDPATPRGAALLDRMVNQQAQIIAYVDDYVLLIMTTLPACVAAVADADAAPGGAGGDRGDGIAPAGSRHPPAWAARSRVMGWQIPNRSIYR